MAIFFIIFFSVVFVTKPAGGLAGRAAQSVSAALAAPARGKRGVPGEHRSIDPLLLVPHREEAE